MVSLLHGAKNKALSPAQNRSTVYLKILIIRRAHESPLSEVIPVVGGRAPGFDVSCDFSFCSRLCVNVLHKIGLVNHFSFIKACPKMKPDGRQTSEGAYRTTSVLALLLKIQNGPKSKLLHFVHVFAKY